MVWWWLMMNESYCWSTMVNHGQLMLKVQLYGSWMLTVVNCWLQDVSWWLLDSKGGDVLSKACANELPLLSGCWRVYHLKLRGFTKGTELGSQLNHLDLSQVWVTLVMPSMGCSSGVVFHHKHQWSLRASACPHDQLFLTFPCHISDSTLGLVHARFRKYHPMCHETYPDTSTDNERQRPIKGTNKMILFAQWERTKRCKGGRIWSTRTFHPQDPRCTRDQVVKLIVHQLQSILTTIT